LRVKVDRLGAILEAVTPFATPGDALLGIAERRRAALGPFTLSFVNANTLWHACADAAFARDLAGSDLLLRDGVGARLLMALAGRESGANLNGTDFIPALLDWLDEPRTALLGTAEPWLARGGERLARRGAKVVLTAHGFAEAPAYLAAVESARADLVILGMGHPKQERVARALREAVRRPLLIVNAGAFIDFSAGRFPRAPRRLRRLGMEWLFRLCLEPRRLFARYLVRTPGLLLLGLLARRRRPG